MKVYVYPLAGDGIDNISTQQDPVELATVGQHIEAWLGRYKTQGYYRNARMDAVPLSKIKFRLEPEGEAWNDRGTRPLRPEMTPAEQEAWDKWHSLDER